MSSAGEEITNPVTGERIAFLRTATDTGGELLEFDDFWSRPKHRAPEHVHPDLHLVRRAYLDIASERCASRGSAREPPCAVAITAAADQAVAMSSA